MLCLCTTEISINMSELLYLLNNSFESASHPVSSMVWSRKLPVHEWFPVFWTCLCLYQFLSVKIGLLKKLSRNMGILLIVCEMNDIANILILSPVGMLFSHLPLEVIELYIHMYTYTLLKEQERNLLILWCWHHHKQWTHCIFWCNWV